MDMIYVKTVNENHATSHLIPVMYTLLGCKKVHSNYKIVESEKKRFTVYELSDKTIC